MSPDIYTALYCLQNSFHLLSRLILPTTLRGRSSSPILQMRKLWLRERGSDLPKVT